MENSQYLKADVEILNERIKEYIKIFTQKHPDFQPIVEVIYEEEWVDISNGREFMTKSEPIIKTRLELKGHE